MSVALAVALTLLQETPPAAAPIERVIALGKVREVGGGAGGEARVLLELDDKTQLVLHGTTPADEGELRRLAGARVKVLGVKGEPSVPKGDHVRVEQYELVDVGGGVSPQIGRIALLELDGKPRLIFVGEDGRAALLPESWMTKMKHQVGAKIWVAGNRSDVKGELTPSRFAILRPPGKAEAFPDDARIEP